MKILEATMAVFGRECTVEEYSMVRRMVGQLHSEVPQLRRVCLEGHNGIHWEAARIVRDGMAKKKGRSRKVRQDKGPRHCTRRAQELFDSRHRSRVAV